MEITCKHIHKQIKARCLPCLLLMPHPLRLNHSITHLFHPGVSWKTVDLGQQALLRFPGGRIDDAVYMNGRHYVGVGGSFVSFPRNYITIDFGADKVVATSSSDRRTLVVSDTDDESGAGGSYDHAEEGESMGVRRELAGATPRPTSVPTRYPTARPTSRPTTSVSKKNTAASSGMEIRVLDGQKIYISLSIQMTIDAKDLRSVYVNYGDFDRFHGFVKSGLEQTIKRVCQVRRPKEKLSISFSPSVSRSFSLSLSLSLTHTHTLRIYGRFRPCLIIKTSLEIFKTLSH